MFALHGVALSRFRVQLALTQCIGALLVAGCATTPQATPTPLSVEEQDRNLASFDYVWQRINDTFFDPSFGGCDWAAVREELRPRMAAADSSAAAYTVLEDALERLGQSHFGIIPRAIYEDLSGSADGGAEQGAVGLTVRVLDGAALITDVLPASPAAAANVRPGWEIVTINGVGLAPRLQRIAAEYADSTEQQSILANAVQRRLAGPIGRSVTLRLRDGRGGDQEVVLERATPVGQPTRFGNLPTIYTRFASRRVANNTGYVAFNAFFDPVRLMPQFEVALRDFSDADGVILDLRGNPGGVAGMASAVAGWFIRTPGAQLGTMRSRAMTLNLIVPPRPRAYTGPLAILIDGCSASTSEFLAGGLQALGRARVFGMRSAGAALPSVIERLPNGDGFQYAIADYTAVDGQRLEGRGVVPDVEVVPTRAGLLAGRDEILEAATAWIAEEAENRQMERVVRLVPRRGVGPGL